MGPELPSYLLLPPPLKTTQLVLIQGEKEKTETIKNFKKLWNLRVWAFTIDLYAILFLRKGVTMALFSFIKVLMWQAPIHAKYRVISYIPLLDGLSSLACFYSYFFLCYLLGDGQSLGKKLLKLKIESKKGAELSIWQAALRPYGHLIDILSLGSITWLMKAGKKDFSFSDFLSGTRVREEKIAVKKSSELPVEEKWAA